MFSESDLVSHLSNFFSPDFAIRVADDLLKPEKIDKVPSVMKMDKNTFSNWYFKKVPGRENPALLSAYMREELAGGIPLVTDHFGPSITMDGMVNELKVLALQKEFEVIVNSKK